MDLSVYFNEWELEYKKCIWMYHDIAVDDDVIQGDIPPPHIDEENIEFSDNMRDGINNAFKQITNDYDFVCVLAKYNFDVLQYNTLIQKHKCVLFLTDLMYCSKYTDLCKVIIDDMEKGSALPLQG